MKARELTAGSLTENLNEANKLWYGVLRLVITLSSSFLLLSLAFVEKLFPESKGLLNISWYLKASWISLFCTIVSGIIAEIDAAIFHGNNGRANAKILKEIDEKICEGLTQDDIDLPKNYLIEGPIFWGVISVNAFIFSIILMSIALIQNLLPWNIKLIIALVGILAQVTLTIYLLRKSGNKVK